MRSPLYLVVAERSWLSGGGLSGRGLSSGGGSVAVVLS
jgi:hypothetical protein